MDYNDHISAHQLSGFLGEYLSDFEERIGSRVSIVPLGRLKPVADATTKFLLISEGQPHAVIVCSRPASPDLVMRGINLAESVRERIGPRLGDAIIKPIQSGYADGRSYVMLPYCREFASWKAWRVVQRLTLARPLLSWLQEANATAAASNDQYDTADSSYGGMLEYLLRQWFLDSDTESAVRKSIARLESGKWRPRHTIDHNDFWLGNVMLPARNSRHAKLRFPFVLIDWAGANPNGYGIYDLIRLARGLNLSSRGLHRELVAHSKALQCELVDTRGHLLAAFGRLHQHIECFPEKRYIRALRNCLSTFSLAIREID
jgi:hypothetical protein